MLQNHAIEIDGVKVQHKSFALLQMWLVNCHNYRRLAFPDRRRSLQCGRTMHATSRGSYWNWTSQGLSGLPESEFGDVDYRDKPSSAVAENLYRYEIGEVPIHALSSALGLQRPALTT